MYQPKEYTHNCTNRYRSQFNFTWWPSTSKHIRHPNRQQDHYATKIIRDENNRNSPTPPQKNSWTQMWSTSGIRNNEQPPVCKNPSGRRLWSLPIWYRSIYILQWKSHHQRLARYTHTSLAHFTPKRWIQQHHPTKQQHHRWGKQTKYTNLPH